MLLAFFFTLTGCWKQIICLPYLSVYPSQSHSIPLSIHMYTHPSPSFSLLSIHPSVYLLICVHLLPLLLHPFLWLFLVFDIFLQDFAREGIGLAERNQLTQVLYDELMTAILRVIGKLDFSAISKEGEVWFFVTLASFLFFFPLLFCGLHLLFFLSLFVFCFCCQLFL